MTVSTDVSRVTHTGDGSSTVFAIPFYFLAAADIKVYQNGVLAASGYTVTGAGNPDGGSVTFTTAPQAGVTVLARRSPDLLQQIDFPPNDPFPSESAERGLDKLTMIAQDLKETEGRAVRFPEGDDIDGTLPSAAQRASSVYAFDANGNPTTVPLTASVGAGDLRDEVFTAGVNFTAGVTQSLTLSRDYGLESNILVHFDTYAQAPTTYQLNGTQLLFDAPIPAGTNQVWVKGGTTISLEVPAAGSVTDSSVAVDSNLYNRITRIYDVRDFGAKCDGVTDDAALINEAETEIAAAGGGILIFPPGTTIAGSMLVKRGNIIWQGAGIGATVIKAKDGATMNWLVATLNADALWGSNSVSGEYAFGLRDITLDGNKAGGAHCGGFGIYGATFNLYDYEIANCTGPGLRTEFGIPGIIPHGYNSQSNSNNALIHDCDGIGIIWGGPSDPSLLNNNLYRNQPYNMVTQVNGTGCKLVNCHLWGSVFDSRLATTGLQLNTSGNLIINSVFEGSTVHQVHMRSSGNVIVGGNIYYFSDAEATVYGVTLGDVGIPVSQNTIKTKIDNCKLGAINFANDSGNNDIEVTGIFVAANGFAYTGARGANSRLRFAFTGTPTIGNNNFTIEPNSLYLPGRGGGDGFVTVGAADSGGAGFRVLRVPN